MKIQSFLKLSCALFLISGCGKEDRIKMAESNAKSGCNVILLSGITSWQPRGSKADLLYNEMVHEEGTDYLEMKVNPSATRGMSGKEMAEKWRSGEFANAQHDYDEVYVSNTFEDYAFSKRTAALVVARCGFTYQFGNYYHLDGVSGLIYNVAYFFSIPRKLLTYGKCADGISGYAYGVAQLLFGGVCSIVGCVAATAVNTICHPLETLSNLLVGVGYFDHWLTCVANTNLIASLWDLIWGGIIYPLFKAIVFWM